MNVTDELLDKPRAVRAGEQLDSVRLAAYLRALGPEFAGALSVEQFPAGFSNLTYLVRVDAREFVLRRPPFGSQVKTAHDMGREFLLLSRLHPVYPKVPRPLHYCADESVLGAPFYLMERIGGVILRAGASAVESLPPQVLRRLSESFGATLAEIHAVDYAAAGLGELGRPEGYCARQVAGWTRRYYNARTDDVPAVEQLARWLAAHVPPESGRALIHNDFKYDNVVLAATELPCIVAVLDWEMATIGDPLLDLGTTLSYWVDPDDPAEWQHCAPNLTTRPGNLSRSALLAHYARASGRDIPDPVFYFAYGLLKVAGIVQQIYYRYRQGLTGDARFAHLGRLVQACGMLGQRAIELGRIDRLG